MGDIVDFRQKPFRMALMELIVRYQKRSASELIHELRWMADILDRLDSVGEAKFIDFDGKEDI